MFKSFTNNHNGDSLSSKLLKMAAPAIASSVTKVINLSLTSGKFPSIWKIASVPNFQKW